MFRLLSCFFLLSSSLCVNASEWEGSEISYGGLTVQCKWGCGDENDPNMESIYDLLTSTVHQVFKKDTSLLDENQQPHFVTPWSVRDYECRIYNWESSNGEWREHNHKAISYRSPADFKEVANQLYRDLEFYYLISPDQMKNSYLKFSKRLQKGYDKGYRCFSIDDGKIEFGSRTAFGGGCPYDMDDIEFEIKLIQKSIQQIDEGGLESKYEDSKSLIDKTIQEIDEQYKEIFVFCLENHQEEGLKFKTALESLIIGDFEEAFNQINFLIHLAEKNNYGNQLISKLYLLKGQVQSEYCLYADAILALTSSIQKNPMLKEAYFQRAAAYFELGEFDKAIEDYLESGLHPKQANWKTSAKFGAGIIAGLTEGGAHSLIDFFPETLSTLRGIGKGLWALGTHPIDSSNAFADAAWQCIKYIKKTTSFQLLQDMVPELKELIQNFDQLDDYQRGSLIGQAVGRYSVDILACKYSAKATKAFIDLKMTNQAMTLEALASPQTRHKIVEEAGKCLSHRELVIKNSNLKLLLDDQGKHLTWHRNYLLSKSTWEYPLEKTQELINKFAGTGIKGKRSNTHIPGMPGYQEIVNFKEFIGYTIDKTTELKIPTTWGKIHYSKNGVHVVPYKPIGE